MAKAKVKVGIYKKSRVFGYGYDTLDLISEEKFEELVADRAKELTKEESEFENYLSDTYSYEEVFDMNEKEKAEVREEFAEKCVDWARDDLNEDWDYEEVEIEVEIPAETAPKKPKAKCPCPCNQF